MPKGAEGPKGPQWKGSKSPEAIKKLNEEASAGVFEKRAEENRNALLAGIDRELIVEIRERCHVVLLSTEMKDLEEANKLLDETIRIIAPVSMINALHFVSEDIRKEQPVYYASIANAFLALTEGY